MTKNIEIQNEIMENQIEKQNIGMSVDIDIEVTENEIKNKEDLHIGGRHMALDIEYKIKKRKIE